MRRLIFLLSLLVAMRADALATYQYTGLELVGSNHLNGSRITGWIIFDQVLAPNLFADVKGSIVDYHFEDGTYHYARGVNYVTTAILSTDASGAIAGVYYLDITGTGNFVFNSFPPRIVLREFGDTAYIEHMGESCPSPCDHRRALSNAGGTWQLVPEPATAALVMLGIVALATTRRRKR